MAQELVASCTVLESNDHGPELCLGALLLSNPPQGGGPAITNWDWSRVSGHESHDGTTWGVFTVIGTYANDTFTLTRPPVPVPIQTLEDAPEPEWGADLATPCPTPPGGWRVIDPERTTDDSLERTVDVAEALPGFADVWVDERQAPVPSSDRGDDDDDDDEVWGMNDPENLILNVAVTGDLGEAEATLRQTWGGALCVSHARHSARELQRILDELEDQPGLLMAGSGRDHVDLEVIFDDGSLQRALDEKYPAGLIRITSALRPYAPA